MADFTKAFQKLLVVEGGFAHLSGDVGGRTMYGISERFFPNLWANGPPTLEDARMFYATRYWHPMGLQSVTSQKIADELLDTAVNLTGVGSGYRRCVVWLQYALNKLRREYTHRSIAWTPLKEDGVLGPVSVAAVNEYTQRGVTYERALFSAIEAQQAMKYLEESQPQFVRGHLAQRTEQWGT